MARFMYGRNGADQLCWALFIAELVLSLLPALVPGQAFAAFIHYTTLYLCVYLLFRMFSRNLEKRRAYNAKFMQWWGPKQSALRGAKARLADKEHKYVMCSCGTYCRVPRSVGTVELTCPKCGKLRIVKTRKFVFFKKPPKGAFFVYFDDPFCSKPPMSTRCLPAETPGAQGFAGFPRGSPSTLPSTHFFAPIPETPAIAAKIFEISENV